MQVNVRATGSINKPAIKKAVREMTLTELKAHCRQVFNMANKRIDRLERQVSNQNILSPALRAVKQSGGHFTYGGRDLNGLRKEYARAQSFLTMETSTVSGAQAYTKPLLNAFGDMIYNPKVAGMIFDALHRIQEAMPVIYKSGVMDVIINDVNARTEKELMKMRNDESAFAAWLDNLMQAAEKSYTAMITEMASSSAQSMSKIW